MVMIADSREKQAMNTPIAEPRADRMTTARDPIHPFNLSRRVWVLCLVDAVEQAGLTPIRSDRLHRLAFLANCLSPTYGLDPLDGKIYKYRSGPLYPDIQWDLDRMAMQGLIQIADIAQIPVSGITLFAANYSMQQKGIEIVQEFARAPQICRRCAFLAEVAAAFGSLRGDNQEFAALKDATYDDPDMATGDLIDFAEWQDRNFSTKTANAFGQFVPGRLPLNNRDRLYLYFRYLDRVVGTA
jgi:hypothetical protein